VCAPLWKYSGAHDMAAVEAASNLGAADGDAAPGMKLKKKSEKKKKKSPTNFLAQPSSSELTALHPLVNVNGERAAACARLFLLY
jgi:hypothetical protein